MSQSLPKVLLQWGAAGGFVYAGKLIFFPTIYAPLTQHHQEALTLALLQTPSDSTAIPSLGSNSTSLLGKATPLGLQEGDFDDKNTQKLLRENFDYKETERLLSQRPIKETALLLQPLNDLQAQLQSLRDGIKTDFTMVGDTYRTMPPTRTERIEMGRRLECNEEFLKNGKDDFLQNGNGELSNNIGNFTNIGRNAAFFQQKGRNSPSLPTTHTSNDTPNPNDNELYTRINDTRDISEPMHQTDQSGHSSTGLMSSQYQNTEEKTGKTFISLANLNRQVELTQFEGNNNEFYTEPENNDEFYTQPERVNNAFCEPILVDPTNKTNNEDSSPSTTPKTETTSSTTSTTTSTIAKKAQSPASKPETMQTVRISLVSNGQEVSSSTQKMRVVYLDSV